MKKRNHQREGNDKSEEEINNEFEKNVGNHEDSIEKDLSKEEGSIPVSDCDEQNQTDDDKSEEKLKSLQEKLAEMQDKYLRLSAEFDNYRKRTLKEKMELSKYAEENVLLKIIPFMDDFDRAIQHLDTTDIEAMKNGVQLIYGKFAEFLKQSGVKEIEASGYDFNVDLHEAVAKINVDDEDKKGKVIDVILKGYFLRDKVLRYSKVIVGE